jgi:hypothetical protein
MTAGRIVGEGLLADIWRGSYTEPVILSAKRISSKNDRSVMSTAHSSEAFLTGQVS